MPATKQRSAVSDHFAHPSRGLALAANTPTKVAEAIRWFKSWHVHGRIRYPSSRYSGFIIGRGVLTLSPSKQGLRSYALFNYALLRAKCYLTSNEIT